MTDGIFSLSYLLLPNLSSVILSSCEHCVILHIAWAVVSPLSRHRIFTIVKFKMSWTVLNIITRCDKHSSCFSLTARLQTNAPIKNWTFHLCKIKLVSNIKNKHHWRFYPHNIQRQWEVRWSQTLVMFFIFREKVAFCPSLWMTFWSWKTNRFNSLWSLSALWCCITKQTVNTELYLGMFLSRK